MNLRFFTVIATACIIAVVVSPSQLSAKPNRVAQHGDANYNYIKGAYDYRNYGFVTRDCNRIYMYTTPDFVFVDSLGRHTKSDCIQRAYQMLELLYKIHGALSQQTTFSEVVTRTTTIKSFLISQDHAVVLEMGTVHVSTTAGEGRSQATSTGDRVDGVYRDIWVRAPQGWLEQKSVKVQ